jgi:hypothetical protein
MDRYGYLENPGEGYQLVGNPRQIPWKWIAAGGAVAGGLALWLLFRHKSSNNAKLLANQYYVTAPVAPLFYEGAGMPYGIQYFEPALDYYTAVDLNGIGRVYSYDGRPGGLVQVAGGNLVFVDEVVWNYALWMTRTQNKDHLLAVMPYAMVGSGYIAYITEGPHIGQSVFVTLAGQIGQALYRSDDGELTFVPLEIIDQMAGVWNTYIKPGG